MTEKEWQDWLKAERERQEEAFSRFFDQWPYRVWPYGKDYTQINMSERMQTYSTIATELFGSFTAVGGRWTILGLTYCFKQKQDADRFALVIKLKT